MLTGRERIPFIDELPLPWAIEQLQTPMPPSLSGGQLYPRNTEAEAPKDARSVAVFLYALGFVLMDTGAAPSRLDSVPASFRDMPVFSLAVNAARAAQLLELHNSLSSDLKPALLILLALDHCAPELVTKFHQRLFNRSGCLRIGVNIQLPNGDRIREHDVLGLINLHREPHMGGWAVPAVIALRSAEPGAAAAAPVAPGVAAVFRAPPVPVAGAAAAAPPAGSPPGASPSR